MNFKQKRNNNKNPNKSAYSSYAKYSGLVFQMGFIIAIFTFGGHKLDKLLKLTFPTFLSIGLLLGIFIGIYIAIKDFIKTK